MMKVEYSIRSAETYDHDFIYALKSASIFPYVEKIWGWDEPYQRNDFDGSFSAIEQFYVIEIHGKSAGFVQYYFEYPYYVIVEIHLLPEYRSNGIGSNILRRFQKLCISQKRKICIGCFKENFRANNLYRKLGFELTGETDTHYILEYGRKESAHTLAANAKWRSNSVQETSLHDDTQIKGDE